MGAAYKGCKAFTANAGERRIMGKPFVFRVVLLAAMLTACAGSAPKAAAQTEGLSAAAESETTKTPAPMESKETVPESADTKEEPAKADSMRIQIQGNGHTVVFELNDSQAARSLYSQLPLTIEVKDYSTNEKIFYPPEELETEDTPLTEGGGEGRMAYFAPWGDVVMYYGDFGPYSGLYDLGAALSGAEWIEALSGEITMKAAEDQP